MSIVTTHVLALDAPYPNPARAAARVTYTLPSASHATLALYDVLGREVAVLVDEQQEAGVHTATIPASQLPSGVYVYKLTAKSGTLSRTLTVAH